MKMQNCPANIFSFFIVILSLQSCSKNDLLNNPVPGNSTITISSFKIAQNNNDNVLSDIVFTIKQDTIFGALSKYNHAVIPSFVSNASKVTVNNSVQVSGFTKVDFKNTVTYSCFDATGEKRDFFVNISWNDSLPHITINTEVGAPVDSKDDYVNATVTIDGRNLYNNYSGTTRIKGRGNTTWYYPKKPYRLKLDEAASLFGLAEEKDWVLLANYLDGTHLLNNLAFNIGHMFGMPYTNNGIPVELTLNGIYMGMYLLTEQVEAGENRVNVGDDGLLLEFDTNYDEDYKFKSANYQLPVNIKNPELEDSSQIVPVEDQFNVLDSLVYAPGFPNNNYPDYIDQESLVKYLLTYMLTDNEEINHPKSTNMYKTVTGKFMMGPIWDFDWAYGYERTQIHFSYYDGFFWDNDPRIGTNFFSRFLSDSKITSLLKQEWPAFVQANAGNLQSFIDEWAYRLEGARKRDHDIWHRGNVNYATDISALKTWLINRINYLNTYMSSL